MGAVWAEIWTYMYRYSIVSLTLHCLHSSILCSVIISFYIWNILSSPGISDVHAANIPKQFSFFVCGAFTLVYRDALSNPFFLTSQSCTLPWLIPILFIIPFLNGLTLCVPFRPSRTSRVPQGTFPLRPIWEAWNGVRCKIWVWNPEVMSTFILSDSVNVHVLEWMTSCGN